MESKLPRERVLFWGALALALFGRWVHAFAQAWLVFQLSASSAWLAGNAAAAALAALPALAWAARGGTRLPVWRLLLGAQLGLSSIAALCAAATAFERISAFGLVLASVAYGALSALDSIACAQVVGSVEKAALRVRAGRVHSWLINSMRALAPLSAGAWLAAGGPLWACFLLNAAAGMALAFWTWLHRPEPAVRPCASDALRSGIGAAELRALSLLCAYALFALPALALLPALARSLGGEELQVLARLAGGLGLGACLMSSVVCLIPPLSPRSSLSAGAAAAGLAALLLGVTPLLAGTLEQWIWSLGLGAVTAAVFGFLVPELHRGAAIRGRRVALGKHAAIQLGLAPLATLSLGGVAQACGIQLSLAVCGGFLGATVLALEVLRAWRKPACLQSLRRHFRSAL